MKRMCRLLSLLLTLCILLGAMSSCMTLLQISQAKAKWDRGEFQPKEDQSWRVYDLNDSHKADFEAALEELRQVLAKDSAGIIEINEAMMRVQELYYYINDQATTAYILYNEDLSNKAAGQNYLYASQMAGEVSDAYMAFCREIYHSDYQIRESFFMEWSDKDIKQLEGWSSEYVRLQSQNDALLVSYYELDSSAADYNDRVAALYTDFVQNNHKIAESFGYENYPQFAYELMYLRDYTAEDVASMRGYVKDYLIPLFCKASDGLMAATEQLTDGQLTLLRALSADPFRQLDQSYVENYFASLPMYMQFYMRDVTESGRGLFTENQASQEGAFTAYYYGEGYPVCYFGPGYHNMFTVVHESGHYYAMAAQQGGGNNLDLSEVYSQANEMLFLRYLSNSGMDAAVYRALELYQLTYMLQVIIISVMVDDFESRVYTADVSTLTGKELDGMMDGVVADYGADFVEGYLEADMHAYWRMVTIQQPMYYISYAVAGVAAMQFYSMALADYDEAVSTYGSLIHNVTDYNLFLASLTDEGIFTPFQAEAYQNMQSIFEEK